MRMGIHLGMKVSKTMRPRWAYVTLQTKEKVGNGYSIAEVRKGDLQIVEEERSICGRQWGIVLSS